MTFLLPLRKRLYRIRKNLNRKFGPGADGNFIGFNKYQEHGAYHWTQHNADFAARVEVIRQLTPEGGVCVDLGCGDAAFFGRLSAVAGRLIGIDADYDAIRWARRKIRENNIGNAVCYNKPISSVSRRVLKLRKGADLVYSMDAIEHLPDPEELLRVCSRIVSKSGTVAIGTPLYVSEELVSPYHVKEFTLEEFQELCGRYFRVRETRLLPERRKDGKVYENNYCILVLEPPDPPR